MITDLDQKILDYYQQTGADKEKEEQEVLQALQDQSYLRRGLDEIAVEKILGIPRTLVEGVVGIADVVNEYVWNPLIGRPLDTVKNAIAPNANFSFQTDRGKTKQILEDLRFDPPAPVTNQEQIAEIAGTVAQELIGAGKFAKAGKALGFAARAHPVTTEALSQGLSLASLGQGDTEATGFLGAEGVLTALAPASLGKAKMLTALAAGGMGAAGSYALNEDAPTEIHALAGLLSTIFGYKGPRIIETFQDDLLKISTKPQAELTEADWQKLLIGEKYGFDTGSKSERPIRLKTRDFFDTYRNADAWTASGKAVPVTDELLQQTGVITPPTKIQLEDLIGGYATKLSNEISTAKTGIKQADLIAGDLANAAEDTATLLTKNVRDLTEDEIIWISKANWGSGMGPALRKAKFLDALLDIPNPYKRAFLTYLYEEAAIVKKKPEWWLKVDAEMRDDIRRRFNLPREREIKREIARHAGGGPSILKQTSLRDAIGRDPSEIFFLSGLPPARLTVKDVLFGLGGAMGGAASSYEETGEIDWSQTAAGFALGLAGSKIAAKIPWNKLDSVLPSPSYIKDKGIKGAVYSISQSPENAALKDDYFVLRQIENEQGILVPDTTDLVKLLKDKTSKIEGKVYGKKYLALIDGDKLEFGTIPSLTKFLGEVADNSMAKVYRNGNNQIVLDFDNVSHEIESAFKFGQLNRINAQKRFSESGSVIPELGLVARAATGAIVGAPIGALTNPDNPAEGAKSGAIVGMLAGGLGVPAVKTFANIAKDASYVMAEKPLSKARSLQELKRIFKLKEEELVYSGMQPVKDASSIGRFVRSLEKYMNYNMPISVKSALIDAKGVPAYLIDKVDQAVRKISINANYSKEFRELANDYLENKITLDEIKAKAATPAEKQAIEVLSTGRFVVDELSEMIAKAVANPDLATAIRNNKGKYLSRTFKLFTDPRWKPSEESIEKFIRTKEAREILDLDVETTTNEEIRDFVRQYFEERKKNPGLLFSSTDFGKKIEKHIYQRRKPLTPEFKEILGEIRDPFEKIYHTIMRLHGSAVSARFFSNTIHQKINGLPAYFKDAEAKDNFRRSLLTKLENAKTEQEKIEIQKSLQELSTYYNLDNNVRFGRLRTGIVHRYIWDQLDTWENLVNPIQGPLAHHALSALSAIKLARTAYNPMLIARQFLTAPFFMVYGQADLDSIIETVKVFSKKSTVRYDEKFYKELIEQGIITSDFIRGEFFQTIKRAMPTTYLPSMEELGVNALINWKGSLAKAHQGILETYRYADNFTRVAVYQSAKKRIARELGKKIDDPEVIRLAQEHTNRYTPNYDQVAKAIRYARNMPFMNVFLTYQAETLRIAKNLFEDLADPKKRMHAAASLILMSSTAGALTAAAKHMLLTEKERNEWDNFIKTLPDYARYRQFVPLKKLRNGDWQYIDITPIETHEAYRATIEALMQGDFASALATNPFFGLTNTPFINIVFEQIAGEDLWTKQILPRNDLQKRFEFLLNDLVPPDTPLLGSNAQTQISAFTRNDKGEFGITDLRTGRRVTPLQYVASLTSGLKMGTYRPDFYKDRILKDFSRQENHARYYLRRVLLTDAESEVKQKAIEDYKRILATLIVSTEERLGLKFP